MWWKRWGNVGFEYVSFDLIVEKYSSNTAFFGYSKDKQVQLIKYAEAPSGTHTEEKSMNIEEAKLDEVWDLNAAEDAPTECLADHEEEDDGSE
jgi:hypothetical protein